MNPRIDGKAGGKPVLASAAPVVMAAAVVIAAGLLFALWPRRSSPTTAKGHPTEVLRTALVLQDGRLHRPGDAQAFSGFMSERYPDGTVQSRSAVSEGLLHGLSQGWFTNGQLQVSEHFEHGVSDGLRTRWYPSGSKLSEAHIAHSKLEGTFRKWHENGTLSEQADFSEGQPQGISLAYFPSGSLKARVKLEDGKPVEQRFWKDGESTPRLPEHAR